MPEIPVKTIIFLMMCTILVACQTTGGQGFNNPIMTAVRFSYGISK